MVSRPARIPCPRKPRVFLLVYFTFIRPPILSYIRAHFIFVCARLFCRFLLFFAFSAPCSLCPRRVCGFCVGLVVGFPCGGFVFCRNIPRQNPYFVCFIGIYPDKLGIFAYFIGVYPDKLLIFSRKRDKSAFAAGFPAVTFLLRGTGAHSRRTLRHKNISPRSPRGDIAAHAVTPALCPLPRGCTRS